MTPKRTRRLRARAAALQSHEDYEDYGPEPNMKLSHAFLVVLLLHVVAVGGLYAFNSMKAGRQGSTKSSSPAVSGSRPATLQEKEAGGSGGAGKPPGEEDPAPVAKTPAGETTSTKHPAAPERQVPSSKGWMEGLRNALHKSTAPAASLAATATASAQEMTPAKQAGAEAPVTTPAAGENASAASSPSQGGGVPGKTYLVKAGDTVTRIAADLGVPIPDLEKANGLAGNSVLQVGQILRVPEKVTVQQPVAAATSAPAPGAASPGATAALPSVAPVSGISAPDQGSFQEYTIVKGDNPYRLAKKFHITPDELMKANGITDPKKIQIGQKLRIPPASKKSK